MSGVDMEAMLRQVAAAVAREDARAKNPTASSQGTKEAGKESATKRGAPSKKRRVEASSAGEGRGAGAGAGAGAGDAAAAGSKDADGMCIPSALLLVLRVLCSWATGWCKCECPSWTGQFHLCRRYDALSCLFLACASQHPGTAATSSACFHGAKVKNWE